MNRQSKRYDDSIELVNQTKEVILALSQEINSPGIPLKSLVV